MADVMTDNPPGSREDTEGKASDVTTEELVKEYVDEIDDNNKIFEDEEEDEEEDDSWSESSSEDEDKDLVFVTSSNHRQHEKRGVGSFNISGRDDGEDGDEDGDEETGDKTSHGHDELRELRFTYHRTAFDIDLDELDEHSWRLPHTDVSDYFNFGFNEPTWRSYCAKQLKHRAAQGLGPSSSQSSGASIASASSAVAGVIMANATAAANAVAASLLLAPPPPPQPPRQLPPPPSHGLPPLPQPHRSAPNGYPNLPHNVNAGNRREQDDYWQEHNNKRPRY